MGLVQNLALLMRFSSHSLSTRASRENVDLLSELTTSYSDGFSAGGTNLLFERNHVVNGDDCLTVINGAKNITWRCEFLHLKPLTEGNIFQCPQ